MTVTLRPLTKNNRAECLALFIAEEERHLSQLQEMPDILKVVEEDDTIVARLIYSDEIMVGFGDYSPLLESGLYKIHHFLIDQNHRRRGYAEAGLRLLIAELSQKPDCKEIMVRYMPMNDTGAIELYQKVGFIEDPELDDDGEQIAVLTVTSRSACPRCGEDINAGSNENYCPECNRWICPICNTLCGFEDEDPVCKHYIVEECDTWDGYHDQRQRDPQTLELFAWPENLDSATLTKIDKISSEEQIQLFGPFAILHNATASMFFFEEIAKHLAIPLLRAYNDESGFTIMYFSVLGGDQVWQRLSDARRTLESGIASL